MIIEGILDIATTLRLILDGESSLLIQMKLEKELFFPGIQGGLGGNFAKENKLVTSYFKGTESGFISSNKIKASYFTQFKDWWDDKAIDLKTGIYVSRRDIVKAIADKEGGAHLDLEYDKFYSLICKNSLGTPTKVLDIKQNLYFISLLSIAKEYLEFLSTYYEYRKNRFVKVELEENMYFIVSKCKQNNHLVNNYRLIEKNDLFATIIYYSMERYEKCKHYISQANMYYYRTNNPKKLIRMRVYTEKNDRLIFKLVNMKLGIIAIGIKSKKKFIVFSGSQFYKSSRELYKRQTIKKEIEVNDRWYVLKKEMIFSTKSQAKRYLLAESGFNIDWGTFIHR